MERSTFQIACVVLLSSLIATCGSPAVEGAMPASAGRAIRPRLWPHESSDVPVDARIRFGALENGLRYAWAVNPVPRDRIYLRLHVDVGSLAEEEHELGLAHFLEHMAFNGSRQHPAGTLVPWFQQHGMRFGADSNAYTSYSETVYELDLAEADVASLREGLSVLRDFADGLLLSEAEVEREKGVIDGEERERDTALSRLERRELETLLAGTRMPTRSPIGVADVRARFTAVNLRAFYKKWYRPDAMTLIVVGDLRELDPVPLFTEFFADMRAPDAPRPVEPTIGRPAHLDQNFVHHQPELPSVELTIRSLRTRESGPFTLEKLRQEWLLYVARRILDLRLWSLSQRESTPLLGTSVGSAEALGVLEGEDLKIVTTAKDWRDALATGEQELRRTLEFGFHPSEFDEVRAETLRTLDGMVEQEKTDPATKLLERILAAAEWQYVPTDATTLSTLLRPFLESLTREPCEAAFRTAWAAGELSLSASGNLDLGADATEELAAAFRASKGVPVHARPEEENRAEAHTSDPYVRGSILTREHVDDLDFDSVSFLNGVVVNVKRTDFEAGRILVAARLGEGLLTLEPERWVLGFAAKHLLGGAYEAQGAGDLGLLNLGGSDGSGFALLEDSLEFTGETARGDLLSYFESLCARIEMPTWDENDLAHWKRTYLLQLQAVERGHAGPAALHFFPALFDGDPRMGLPTAEGALGVEWDEVRSWLSLLFLEAPLEVTVVGDLHIQETIALAARTLGRLPPRRDWQPFDERRTRRQPQSGVRQTHVIATQLDKSLVLIVFPIPDGLDLDDRGLGWFLGHLVNDRLRIEVRERLGAAYAPSAATNQSSVFPDFGTLVIDARADPGQAEAMVEACLEVCRTLATDGVTEDEVARVKEPLLKQQRDAKRKNGFWRKALAEAVRKPDSLEAVRAVEASLESLTAADLTPFAREYLQPERASVLVVNPE